MKKRFVRYKAGFMLFVLLAAFFSINLSNKVNADSKVCCEKTNTGNFCLYTDSSKCDLSVRSDNLASSCDQTSYCQLGCCQDSSGSCYKSTSLAACRAMNGLFSPGSNCDNSECEKGCCVISNSCSYVNEKKCDSLLAGFPNLPKDFRPVSSEPECSNTCRGKDLGCCQYSDSCEFTDRDSCSSKAGGFNNAKLCSDISTCDCSSHASKGCFDEDVYWFDSCGNREDKVEDCDYASGAKCGKDINNNFVCKGVNCDVTYSDIKNVHDPGMGKSRKNGESWCVYESGVGDYLDRPGTRHYRHICVNGEELVEPCRDFREEICVQGIVSGYAEAQCIRNNIYDSEITSKISTVAPGFNFWESQGDCAQASQTCEVVYVKKNRMSGWKCAQNCECESYSYIDKMNKWCKSMGDCGANMNILGVRSESGFSVSGDANPPRAISSSAWAEYSRYGVFSGIKFLSDEFEKFSESNAEAPAALFGMGGIGESLVAGAVVSTALTVAAALSSSFASVLTGASFGLTGSSGMATFLPTIAGLSPTIIGAVVVAVVMVVTYVIFGGAKVRTYHVITQCSPWQAPAGGNDCGNCRNAEKFNKLGVDDCTEYKCRSLGKFCSFIPENEGSSRVSCFARSPYDVNSPVIIPWPESLTPGYSLTDLDYGFSITPAVKPFSLISFGIRTDELSQCKLSSEHKDSFDAMPDYFGDSYFAKEHNITLNLAGGSDYSFYVRCKDSFDNKNNRDYIIKISADPVPDSMPPVVDAFDPPSGSYLPSNLSQATVGLLLNEPSNCKFSTDDKDYDLMESEASCEDEIHATFSDPYYDCFALLNLSQGVNDYYFRCVDLNGNKNSESYHSALFVSDPLVIVYSSPSGSVYDTNSPVLEVTTAGGSQSGVSSCGFSASDMDFDSMIPFFSTSSSNHKQNLLNLPKADYDYYVKCRDSVGNEASKVLSFSITSDTTPPSILYLYSSGSSLYLGLDEPSTCEYSNSSFVYGSGLKMSGSGASMQMISVDSPNYFINCVDNYNNKLSEIKVYL